MQCPAHLCITFCNISDANEMIGMALGQHIIRESGAGLLENVVSLQPTSFLQFYMLNDFSQSWELPSNHASIKSMLPLTEIFWGIGSDQHRVREKETLRNNKKSFVLISITRCLVTLLCCNFSLLSVYFDMCIHASLRRKRPSKTFLILIWVRVSLKFRILKPFVHL